MWGFFRGMTALAAAAAIAPFVFFLLLIMGVIGGAATFAFGPLVLAFITWMMLSRWARRERDSERRRSEVIEARIISDEPLPYAAQDYTPAAHFDLLLSAKHDIGRIRGSVAGIEDPAIARAAIAVADQADAVLGLVIKEPAKSGLARRFFSSYLPRAAELSAQAHRLISVRGADETRKRKLLDLLSRLETAMKAQGDALHAAELSRLDVDMRLLTEDLRAYASDDFRRAPEPIVSRVEEVVRKAKKTP